MSNINDAVIKISNLNDVLKTNRLIAKTGDTKGRDLVVQMVGNDGKGLDMSGSRLTLAYKTPSGVSGEIVFLPENEVEGLYKLTYDAGLTHEAGVVTASIRLKTFDTVVETVNFEIYVEASPLGGVLFEEIDGLTFKKVMDRVDSVELRAELIEKDILHIDDQLQDMNTRIVYVEDDDSIDQRLYDAENDIDLLESEADRLSGEIEAVKEEIKGIEVGGGGSGTGTTEKDTGWRVFVEGGDYQYEKFSIYVRRLGNEVFVYGVFIKSGSGTATKYLHHSGGSSNNKLPGMFLESQGNPALSGYSYKVAKTGDEWGTVGVVSELKYNVNDDGRFVVVVGSRFSGYIDGSYFTNRPFTDEYMDLPLADFH